MRCSCLLALTLALGLAGSSQSLRQKERGYDLVEVKSHREETEERLIDKPSFIQQNATQIDACQKCMTMCGPFQDVCAGICAKVCGSSKSPARRRRSSSGTRRRRTKSSTRRRRRSSGGGSSIKVKILTYNLFWWNLYQRRGGNGGSASRLIAHNNNPSYDFMGFQECDDVARVLRDGGLTSQYGTLNGGHGLAIAYRTSRWSLVSSGQRDVGKDRHDQYFGTRGVNWGRFRHKKSGKHVFFMNFHGPLPVGTGGAYGGTTTAQNIAGVIREKARSKDKVFMVGDFNHGPGTSLINELERTLKRMYTGRSFGGVDHIFSKSGTVISKRNLGNGGSDHDALDATIKV